MKKTISIVGGGAAALMLGCELNTQKYAVSIFEKNTALGRKFLVAGDGGLNLTHSENVSEFILKYTPHDFLIPGFSFFSNKKFIDWLNNLGIETFTGSSGRIFPKKGMKPIEVLSAIEKKIKANGVALNFKHEWQGFSENSELFFKTTTGIKKIKSDYVIFCLGGASWQVTGSSGNWLHFFKEKNITVNNFQASNCNFKVNWPTDIIKKIEGKPIKNITITCDNKINYGEVVITSSGLEGSGIYPLSPQIRKGISEFGLAKIYIDFKPTLSFDELLKRISKPDQTKSYTENCAKQLNINKVQLNLLKSKMSKLDFLDFNKLITTLKKFELQIYSLDEIENAISTVGGISLTEISPNYELKKIKNNFVIGEMLDYDAPTGGYLLQSCFTMANFLATYLNKIIN